MNTAVNTSSVELNFIHKVRQHLNSLLNTGVLEGFVCTALRRRVYSATLFNGIHHTKGPLQENRPFQLDVSLLMPEQKGVGFSLEAMSMQLFIYQLEFALAQAVELRHRMHFEKQSSYPKLALSSDEILRCFEQGHAASRTTQILEDADLRAALVTHPRMMNREVSASIAMSSKIYTDSSGNFVEEMSTSSSLMVSFSLEDSSESHSDLFSALPTANEIKRVVEEASKNIVRVSVKPLDEQKSYPVLLTHKAVGDLFDQLVLPNLETRTLLDKTGAWEFGNLDSRVLADLTIEDNPHLDQSPFSAVFDFEGTPTKPVKIIKSGFLVHPLMTSTLLAEVEGLYPQLKGRFLLTGHAESTNTTSFTNLFFRVEKPPLFDLSKHSYIQVQNLTGMSVDPLTGQFALDSDGAKVYDEGKLSYSTSLTLRGNLFEALKHPSTRVGQLERHFNSWTPSLYTEALSCVSKELAQNFEEDNL